MKNEKELTINFELNEEGYWNCRAESKVDLNQTVLNVSGKLCLIDGKDVLNIFARFVKELEYYSDAEFSYRKVSPSK